ARRAPLPARALRMLADTTFRLRLQPTPPGWIDLALNIPIMDTTRARTQLGWRPLRSGADALLDLLGGMREGAGAPSPPLAPSTGGPLRARKILTGVGARHS